MPSASPSLLGQGASRASNDMTLPARFPSVRLVAQAPEDSPACDVREISRVVASVLLASGAPGAEDVARANRGLARLGRPALNEHDASPTTPEELARSIPEDVRAFLSELLFELAGADALRRRVAQSYAALWGCAVSRPSPEPS